MEKAEIWGSFLVGTSPVPQLPAVGHILGVQLQRDDRDQPSQIHVQYESSDGHYQLSMPFLDGMFLLSLLKAIQLDTDTPFPDDPRAPT